MGMARVQSAFDGLSKKELRRDSDLEFISTSLEFTGYGNRLYNGRTGINQICLNIIMDFLKHAVDITPSEFHFNLFG